MKKYFAFAVLMAFTMCIAAKSHTIVVKGDKPTPKGATRVFAENPDTIIVVPVKNAYDIEINVKDIKGNTISQFFLPTQTTSSIDVDFTNENVIEIKDEDRIVYVQQCK